MPPLTPELVNQRFSAEVRTILQEAARDCHADESSLWLKHPEHPSLLMTVNSGPRASEVELVVEQPLSEGIVSQVFREGKPVLEKGAWGAPEHSFKVDIEQQQATHYLAAAPVTGEAEPPLGVISVVQIQTSGGQRKATSWGLAEKTPEVLSHAAASIARLLHDA